MILQLMKFATRISRFCKYRATRKIYERYHISIITKSLYYVNK